jgi:hypothetical protein
MHRIYLATLTALFSFMAAVAAETQQSHVNFDIWFVNDLVEDLSKDDFSERERATLRLIALGPIVVQEINEHISIERLDAEARERLERVKRDAEFALLTTFESATAEYERIVNEVLELDAGRYAQLVLEKRARADRLLERLEAMSAAQNRSRTLADLLVATGERLYSAPGSIARTPALRFAIADLQSAVYFYELSLSTQPDQPGLRMAHSRAVTLLGSARWADNPRFE